MRDINKDSILSLTISLTCVHQHVALEKVVFSEASGAKGTSVGPRSIVDEHVALEISWSRETLVTYCTLMRLILIKG